MTDFAETEFQKVLLERIDEAESVTSYSFAGIRKMIDELGGVQAAKRLVSPGSTGALHPGFKVLAGAGLLRCSVEQTVIDFADAGLFDDAEVSNARARIAMAKMLLK